MVNTFEHLRIDRSIDRSAAKIDDDEKKMTNFSGCFLREIRSARNSLSAFVVWNHGWHRFDDTEQMILRAFPRFVFLTSCLIFESSVIRFHPMFLYWYSNFRLRYFSTNRKIVASCLLEEYALTKIVFKVKKVVNESNFILFWLINLRFLEIVRLYEFQYMYIDLLFFLKSKIERILVRIQKYAISISLS